VNVTLSQTELRYAAANGVERRIQALAKKRRGAHGFDRAEVWDIDIEGLAAELAVAKALGVYYAPVVGQLDTDLGDVMPGVQVRSSKHPAAHLLLHPTDSDSDRFVLVTGSSGTYRICGWCYGCEGKLQSFWKNHAGRTAFWVPQASLRPFEPKVTRVGE
jgi:hypothetical protein